MTAMHPRQVLRSRAWLFAGGFMMMGLAACSSDDASSGTLGQCTNGASTNGITKANPPGIPGLPGTPSGSPGSTALEEVTSFGANPAGLKMYVHAPSSAPKAVVLALHGCTQSASDYVSTGWNEVGDREGLVIVYGEQTTTNNSTKCFRWWDASQIAAGGGEAESLANMVRAAREKYGVTRSFVTGLSAGGAMTTVMLAAYPDLFEAGAIMAGLPYKCATSQLDAYTCMSGRSRSADEWAALVQKASGAGAPRVSVWQGDADYTVRPSNRDEIVKQWTKVNGLDDKPSESTKEGPAEHDTYRDTNGTVRVESWTIAKMGHGVALDPKSGCGKAGAYELDVGLCSTTHAAAFFLGTSSGGAPSASSSGGAPGVSQNPCP